MILHSAFLTPNCNGALDGMLDFCFDDDLLALYRKLCRYYFTIDPGATASYVEAYREMWEGEGKSKKAKGKNGKGKAATRHLGQSVPGKEGDGKERDD